jgi:hypothetical protein
MSPVPFCPDVSRYQSQDWQSCHEPDPTVSAWWTRVTGDRPISPLEVARSAALARRAASNARACAGVMSSYFMIVLLLASSNALQ